MAIDQNQDGLGEFINNAFGEQYLHAVNRDSFYKSGSEAVYQRYFGERLWDPDSLHIIIGTDSGLLPRYVHNHGPGRGSRYLFIELPALIDKLTTAGLTDNLDGNIALVSPDDWLETAKDFNLLDYLFLDTVHIHQSIGAADAYIPDYQTLSLEIQDQFSMYSYHELQSLMFSGFADKMLLTLTENQVPCSSLLKEKPFKGYTAVVAAGGPSLDSQIPWIKQHRDEIVLFAVSRICRRLEQVDLRPDIVVSIDPTHMSFEISKEMLAFWDSSLLINSNHVNESLLGQWRGRSVYLGNRFPWDSELDGENLAVFGPSVTNSALMVAIKMEFSQIILAGVDLCFTREGHSHALGSDERKIGSRIGHLGTCVKTNSGRLADTDYPFAHAVTTIAKQAEYSKQHGCTIINPSPEAAQIEHVLHMPIEEINLHALNTPARDIIDQLLPTSNKQDRLDYYERVQDELGKMRYSLEKIHAIATQAIKDHEKLYAADNTSDKYKKRIERAEKQLDNDFPMGSKFVKTYGLRRFAKLVRPDDDMEWSREELDNTGRGYYTAYRDTARYLLDFFSSIEERILCRLQEESDAPDLQCLAAQWRKDRQPGRVLIWEQRSPQAFARLKQTDRKEIESLQADYQTMVSAENVEHNRKASEDARIEMVRAKAIILFQKQDTEGLSDMINALRQDPRPEAEPYLHIAEGYLAELEQRDADALHAYQQVTEGPLLEDGLKRIALITLEHQDLENAALTLDCLSAISPTYLPQYAEIMRLKGDIAQAAELYTQYLDHAPDDLNIAIRLGRLYQDNNIKDVALQIFDYVLNKDPKNQAAQQLRQQLENSA